MYMWKIIRHVISLRNELHDVEICLPICSDSLSGFFSSFFLLWSGKIGFNGIEDEKKIFSMFSEGRAELSKKNHTLIKESYVLWYWSTSMHHTMLMFDVCKPMLGRIWCKLINEIEVLSVERALYVVWADEVVKLGM